MAFGIVAFLLVTPAISIPISLKVLTDNSYTMYPLYAVENHGILLPANKPSSGYKGVRVTSTVACQSDSSLTKVVVTSSVHTVPVNVSIDGTLENSPFERIYTAKNFAFNAQVMANPNGSQFQLKVIRTDIKKNSSIVCSNTYLVNGREVNVECNSTDHAGYYNAFYVPNNASGGVKGTLTYDTIDISKYENSTSSCTINGTKTSYCSVPIKFTDTDYRVIVILEGSVADCPFTVTYEADYATPNVIISTGTVGIIVTLIACIGCICCCAVCRRKKSVTMYGVSVEETGN